ncbi:MULTISPECIES: hypothetical protein [unclassified Mesorhizobium]|uniref:hypothetical protein n=1 Tax=unclassified Mesorhizobium TaxID=325217 RepID=UPI000FCB2F5F|nr:MULTISPECIES: hypothetical protein [unclassified Mesorhizobium]RUV16959.1 hypothetical protein EOA91_19580 [Mesorhizobium sp. M1A.F.Ca.IN.022.04.1.1]RWG29740.1 MAG: hypothetical protein EOQ60_20385 [Mesorhizobium sp.]
MSDQFLPENAFAPDTPFANIGGEVDYELMNKGITPIFFIQPVHDQAASDKEGAPRYKDMEHVRLMVAGDPFNVPVLPVDEAIKQRFAVQYERWKAQRANNHVDGTPLRDWPLLTPAQIAEFNALNIFSVQQLSEVADTYVNKIHDGRVWRKKAKDFLRLAKDSGVVNQQAAEIARLQEKVEELTKTILDLSARLPADGGKAAA